MQAYGSAVFSNPRGFQARLSVGTEHRGFLVLAIYKIEHEKDAPALPAELHWLFGRYTILVRDKGGCEFEITNNQDFGIAMCLNKTVQKFTVVPSGLYDLSRPETHAEFMHATS